ncbi:MAG: shikimate dehydrogenase [Desulfovermiculus sp.]
MSLPLYVPGPFSALYGVIGHPVGHSLSPILHTWAFSCLQIPGAYLKWDVDASDFAAFTVALRVLPIHGLSVTLPHKQRIIPYLDHMTPEARQIGAVNTVYWQQGSLWGTNTDWQGIFRPLRERSVVPASALILGAGGASLAAVEALRQLGCHKIFLSARDQQKVPRQFTGQDIVSVSWEERGQCEPDVLINTTPLGMAGDLQNQSPWPEGYSLQGVSWVFDLVYIPKRTRLLSEADQAGCKTISGLEMFVSQALGQCELWTGQGFDPRAAYDLLSGLVS